MLSPLEVLVLSAWSLPVLAAVAALVGWTLAVRRAERNRGRALPSSLTPWAMSASA